MSDGVLYKANGSSWTKSVAKKGNGSVITDGKVMHSNGSAWYDNYPMEQLYEDYFNVTWTQGYKYATGQILDNATWGNHPRSGDATADFVGLWGFDRAAMQAFVAGGVVQKLQIEVMFDDPGHNGTPNLDFFPHVYTSKPGSWNGNYANWNYRKNETFGNVGYDYTRWITLPNTAWLGGQFGGVVVHSAATAANSSRFAGTTTSHGLNSFNSRVFIQVLK